MLRRTGRRFSAIQAALPKRMILIRHGESEGNVDSTEYARTPDWKINLTPHGVQQSRIAGVKLKKIVGSDPVFSYVSPFRRARGTLDHIEHAFPRSQLLGEREDPRLREQDFGHLQDPERMKKIWKERDEYGRFFYRFPNGENGADVCDRVSGFIDSLFRERYTLPQPLSTNVVIVTHGLLIRLFVKRWFHFSVDAFHEMKNPPNCGMVVLTREGKYGQARMEIGEDAKEMLSIPAYVKMGGRYTTMSKAPVTVAPPLPPGSHIPPTGY